MPTFSRAIDVTSLVAVAATILLGGCADKAEPAFEHCNELQESKKYNEAREACQRAVAADPESKFGKLAAARIPVIDTEAVAAMRAERAASAASDARIEEAEAKARDLKTRFDAAVVKVAEIQGRLDRATDPADRATLEAELALATQEKAAIKAEGTGHKGSTGKPCSCPPGDPLCSCL